MFNPVQSESPFVTHLRNTHRTETAANHAELRQWLEYWNDADSVAANLRKFDYWLQRAHIQN